MVAFLRLGNPSCGYTRVKRLLYLLAGLLLPGLLHAASSLENARRAQALLGPAIWSAVVQVENTAQRSRYPATVFALVFEEGGLLWFYTDVNGTQSLSLSPDRLSEEKADLARLLQAIEPGFAKFEILPSDVTRVSGPVMENADPNHGSDEASHVGLPNGCFVESLAALTECVRRGEPIERARLLNCYVDTPAGRRGHTVLTYETPRGLFLLDPGRSPAARPMPRAWADDAMALAGAALQGSRVARARWVPTALPLPGAAMLYSDLTNDPVPGVAPRLMR